MAQERGFPLLSVYQQSQRCPISPHSSSLQDKLAKPFVLVNPTWIFGELPLQLLCLLLSVQSKWELLPSALCTPAQQRGIVAKVSPSIPLQSEKEMGTAGALLIPLCKFGMELTFTAQRCTCGSVQVKKGCSVSRAAPATPGEKVLSPSQPILAKSQFRLRLRPHLEV